MPVKIIRDTEPGNPKDVGEGVICVEYQRVRVKYSGPRGDGTEIIAVQIEPDQFAYLARAMMKANPSEAIQAFGDALKRGIPEPADNQRRWMPQSEDRT